MTSGKSFGPISQIPDLDGDGLVKLWRRHLTDKMPAHLPKSILVKLLAHRLQVEEHGGLSRNAASFLKGIEADLMASREPQVPLIDDRQLKPGSVLVREYEGEMHRTMVLDEGFSWNGRTYASLSAVAKAITGTQWNGNRFFGLKQKATSERRAKS